MVFQSMQIKGAGRGKKLGYPTINLEIPKNFHSKEGVYAAWVTIGHNQYKAAGHYGPVPTFHSEKKNLEFFLIDVLADNLDAFHTKPISFELIEYVRPVKKFESPKRLKNQITKDVKKITDILLQ